MRSLLFAAAVVALLSVPASPAFARDSSDSQDSSAIALRLEPVAGGDDRGGLSSQMNAERARLALRVRRLDPRADYTLVLDDGRELARFRTDGDGAADVVVNLLKSGSYSEPPIDPRGHELFVRDADGNVLAAWVYGPRADDPPWAQISERTELERADFVTRGSVRVRYELGPNGKERFFVQPRHVPAGEYGLYVDDLLVATFTPNPAGNAQLDFRSDFHGGGSAPMKAGGPPGLAKGKDDGKGNGDDGEHGHANGHGPGGPPGKPSHNQKLALDFDPRSQLVELRQGADVLFSGPMLAQIPGLNVCRPRVKTVEMTPADPASSAEGTVALGREDDCERTVVVSVAGVPAGSYELVVGGVVEGTIAVAADGAPASIAFANTPDTAGELMLDFPLARGSLVEVRQGAVVVLGVILP